MDVHFGCNIMTFQNDKSDMEQLLEFFTAMTASTNDPRWKVWKSFYISATVDLDVTFNLKSSNFFDSIKQWVDIDEEVIKRNKDFHKQMMPYVNMKIEKFSPRITQLVFKDEHGEFDSRGKNFLNNRLESFEQTLEDPNLKMARNLFDNGLPFVPFPQIERCLGMGVRDAVVSIKSGYVVQGFDFDVEKSESRCLFQMKETIQEREKRMMEYQKQFAQDHGQKSFAEKMGMLIEKSAK